LNIGTKKEEEEDVFRLLQEGLEMVRKYLQQVAVWMRVQWSQITRHLWADYQFNANHAR
jgi:hypothetical protein